jgi:hypothetical protein
MKSLLSILFFGLCSLAYSQTWNFIGSSTGISNASEVDMEISATGQIFIAYIDSDNTNKATVRKWNGTTWVLVGTAGITSSNAFDLQMVLAGENPVIGVKVVTTISTTNYQFLEVFNFNGTTWNSMSLGMYLWTDHSKDFALSVNSANEVFLSFESLDYQSNSAFPYEGLITAKMNSNVLVGGLANNPLSGSSGSSTYLQSISAIATTGNNVQVVYHEDQDMEYGMVLNKLNTSTVNPSNYINSVYNVTKIIYERGTSSTINSMMHNSIQSSYNKLSYRANNGTTYGTRKGIDSSTTLTINDFDFVTDNPNTYVFYKKGTTSYLKQLSGDMTPGAITTISSGTTLAPTSSSSLNVEFYNQVLVVAYISAGKCYVKELDAPANIEDYEIVSLCEESGYTNGGNAVVFCLDNNFSHANLSMTVTSQNTAIIPQSAISTSSVASSANLNWRLLITNTNSVSSTTVVDIRFDLYENGVIVDSYFMPVTVYPKPDIQFLITDNDICENAPVFSLVGKAIPLGGTWTGNGVTLGNNYNASLAPIGPNTLTYTVSNAFGCSNSSSTAGVILEAPDLTVTTVNANCGDDNGQASVSIASGLAPYDISWSNNASTSTISDLEADQYFVIVEDANGCKRAAAAMVGTNGLNQTATIHPVECYGEATGGIELSITGAVAPTTVLWSNGATTFNIANLVSGTYEVIITDATGCVSVGSYSVGQAPLIQLTSVVEDPTSACGAGDGLIDATATGGIGVLDLEYFDIDNNPVSNDPLTAPAGFYNLVVSDINGCSQTFPLTIEDPNGPVIAVDTIISSSCSNDGQIQLINVGNNAVSYLWSNSGTTLNLSNLAPGNYSLQASNASGCVSSSFYTVGATLPQDVEICLITVDTSTNTNLLVWEKPITNDIAYFKIYRETSTSGVYQLIDTVNYTSLSQFTDPVADPSVRSWRYKISAVDACEVEGQVSDFHKTIHLSINLGLGGVYNLLWDEYEGFTYPEFRILRHTNPGGWIVLDQLPTTDFSYTDTPPTTNELDYFIEIVPPSTCTSTKINDFNSSRSNRERGNLAVNPNSINESALENAFLLYPNPANETMTIENFTTQNVALVVTDVSGKIIAERKIQAGLSSLNTTSWDNGLYFFTLEMNGEKIAHRQVVQH